MRVHVIGCCGSFAGPEGAASSYLLEHEDEAGRTWRVLMDLGSGAFGPLQSVIDPVQQRQPKATKAQKEQQKPKRESGQRKSRSKPQAKEPVPASEPAGGDGAKAPRKRRRRPRRRPAPAGAAPTAATLPAQNRPV